MKEPNPYLSTLGWIPAISIALAVLLWIFGVQLTGPDGAGGTLLAIAVGLVNFAALSLVAWLVVSAIFHQSTHRPEKDLGDTE